MKWSNILTLIEEVSDPLSIARNDILDMVTPLRSRGVTDISVKKVIDFLNADPDIQGIEVNLNFVQNAIDTIDGINVHTDANGDYVIGLDSMNNVSPQGTSIDKKGQQKVNAAAVRSAKKDME